MFCVKCGRKLEKGAKFCIECGNPIVVAEKPVPEIPAEESTKKTETEPKQIKQKVRISLLATVTATVLICVAVFLLIERKEEDSPNAAAVSEMIHTNVTFVPWDKADIEDYVIEWNDVWLYNIVPFIIDERHKLFYYRGLKEFENERGYLTDICKSAQDTYRAMRRYFMER